MQGRAYRPRGQALALHAAEEAVLETSTRTFCEEFKTPADSGRARCGLEWCKKLFKSDAFLQKHLQNRHGDHLEAWKAAARRPFMWAAYEADQHKPLPPLRTDRGDEVWGRVELFAPPMNGISHLDRCRRSSPRVEEVSSAIDMSASTRVEEEPPRKPPFPRSSPSSC